MILFSTVMILTFGFITLVAVLLPKGTSIDRTKSAENNDFTKKIEETQRHEWYRSRSKP